MTPPSRDERPSLSLSEGFLRSGLTFEQAWIDYRTMGGHCSREQVMSALSGERDLDGHEHNKLATALNETYVDAGEDHPVATDESIHPPLGRFDDTEG